MPPLGYGEGRDHAGLLPDLSIVSLGVGSD